MNPHFFTAPFCFAFISAMKMVFPYRNLPLQGKVPRRGG